MLQQRRRKCPSSLREAGCADSWASDPRLIPDSVVHSLCQLGPQGASLSLSALICKAGKRRPRRDRCEYQGSQTFRKRPKGASVMISLWYHHSRLPQL